MSKGEIVISGISGRWPKSDNLDEFWENLKQSKPMYEKDDFPYSKCKYFTFNISTCKLIYIFVSQRNSFPSYNSI